MTYISPALQNQMLRHVDLSLADRSALARALRSAEPVVFADTEPMLFRSEGFAEDLHDVASAH